MATVRGGLGVILKSANGGAIPLVDKLGVETLQNSAKKVEASRKLKVDVKKSVGTLNTQRDATVKQINLDVSAKGTEVSKFMQLRAKVDKDVSDMTIAGVEFTESPLLKIKKDDYSKIVGFKYADDIVYYNVKNTNTPQTVQYKRDLGNLDKHAGDIVKLCKNLEDSTKKLDTIKDKEKDELNKLEKEK